MDPWVNHLKAIKQVVQYFKGTMHLELVYGTHFQSENKAKAKTPAGQLSFGLVGYTNNNYANDLKDQKLIIRYYFFIYGAIVS